MMTPPRSVSFYPWMICVLILLIEHSMHVVGYSKCYNEAEKASIPAALMCYNNHVVGPRVVLDVFRAKESSTINCECTVTSDTPTKFSFSNYNNYHPEPGCGSTLIFSANGEIISKQCYVEDMQLPSSNRTDTSVAININGPQSIISTNYCLLIESDVVLNISCKGDSLSSLLTTQTVSTTETMETTTTPTREATTQQTTSQALPSTTEKLDTTSSIIGTTLSQSISSSTKHPIATTEEIDNSFTSSLLNSSTTSSQTIVTTLEITSVVPDTTEKVSTSTNLISSTESLQTTTRMSTSVKQDTTTLMTTNTSTESGAQDTTTILPPLSSTESGAQGTTTTDTSKSSTASDEQKTTANATTLPVTTNNIQMTSLSASTESSTIRVTQHTTVSTALPPMTTHGVASSTSTSSVMQKTTTVIPIVKTTFRQTTAEVPWNGIIPAILIGLIILAALLIAFIKWQRSREIKYPPNSSYSESEDPSNKYPPMGETNFGYDAYEADSGIVSEFSKSPEELEIEYADEERDPKNLTKGPFIRYNVKDYSRNIESVNYNGVRNQAPNGMDVYF